MSFLTKKTVFRSALGKQFEIANIIERKKNKIKCDSRNICGGRMKDEAFSMNCKLEHSSLSK